MGNDTKNRLDEQEHRVDPEGVGAPAPAEDLPIGPSPGSSDLRSRIADDVEDQLASHGDGKVPPLREDYGGPRTATDGTQVTPDLSEGDHGPADRD